MKNLLSALVILFFPILIIAQLPEGNWERSWEMKPGYFRVMQNGMMGVVNADGNILIPCQFSQIYDLTDDNFVKVMKDRKIGLYHLEKGLILPAEYDQIWAFEGEIAKVLKDGKYGFVNRDGYIIIPAEYNHIWNEENGLIKVLQDGKTGFLDKDGNAIIPVEYQQIWSFEGNIAKVQKNGKMGYINRDGIEIIPPIYDNIGGFQNGKARASLEGTVFYFDKEGNIIEVSEASEKHTQPIVPESIKMQESGSVSTSNNANSANTKSVATKTKKTKHFEGHVSSVNMGINGYFGSNFTETLPNNYQFMDLNYERSWEISVYPFQHSTRLIGSHVGLVAALGAQFNNYRFNLYNSSELTEISKAWFVNMPDYADITRAKLTVFSLMAPVMFEIQLPDGKGRKGIYLSGGVIGSVKLNSYTRVDYTYRDIVYEKRRQHNDFGLRVFKYSFMARAGYDWLGIYATYSPMSLFKKDKGPDLFPYSVGVSINF